MLIAEFARLAGMTRDGVRHYEAMGLITSSPRPAGRRVYREYPESALQIVAKVRQAQNLGLSLAEIGPLLRAFDNAEPTLTQTLAFLRDRLAVIRARQAELEDIATFIAEKIARYETLSASVRPGRQAAGDLVR